MNMFNLKYRVEAQGNESQRFRAFFSGGASDDKLSYLMMAMKRVGEKEASGGMTMEEEKDEEDGFEKLAGSHRNAVMTRMSEYQASLPTLTKHVEPPLMMQMGV